MTTIMTTIMPIYHYDSEYNDDFSQDEFENDFPQNISESEHQIVFDKYLKEIINDTYIFKNNHNEKIIYKNNYEIVNTINSKKGHSLVLHRYKGIICDKTTSVHFKMSRV